MRIKEDGIEIHRNYISQSDIEEIQNEMCNSNENYPKHGIRNADKKFETIRQLSRSNNLNDLATAILGSKPNIVRVIFFDKTPDSNWSVSWHQDKTIAVNKKMDIPGWGPWSIKDNTHHVQPSLNVLNQMLTFRLHLDDANENNGCLKVIPRSHKLGIIPQQQIKEITVKQQAYYCHVQAGDLMIMAPHILHASSKSTQSGHRRVIHIEYSNFDLPENLKWV